MGLLTVACVYVPGNGFTDDYVYRLRDGVEQFCEAPHRFVCLTNRLLAGIETVSLIRKRTGWWNKLELFRKNLFPGQVAYLDLDTMIVDDVTDILTRQQPFLGLSDFKHKQKLGSAFMSWDGTIDLSHLDDGFTLADVATYSQSYDKWGDQGVIWDRLGIQMELTNDVFPGRFVSYKWHVRRPGFVPDGASVVMFHGKPRPADVGWKLP